MMPDCGSLNGTTVRVSMSLILEKNPPIKVALFVAKVRAQSSWRACQVVAMPLPTGIGRLPLGPYEG